MASRSLGQGPPPKSRFALQIVNAESAIVRFSSASRRLLRDMDEWLARASWLAAWFQ